MEDKSVLRFAKQIIRQAEMAKLTGEVDRAARILEMIVVWHDYTDDVLIHHHLVVPDYYLTTSLLLSDTNLALFNLLYATRTLIDGVKSIGETLAATVESDWANHAQYALSNKEN